MRRCVIISAGPFTDVAALSGYLLPDDYIIVADGGWYLAQALGVMPAVVVADFDSASSANIPDGVETYALPVEKDVTDTAEALRLAYDRGYRSFLLLGCTGGRLDHYQAALSVSVQYVQRDCEIVLADERNEIHLLTAGNYVFPVCPDEKISFFAFGGDVTGLYLNGMKYTVEDYTLSATDPLCVSNECVEEDACISFKSGFLMMYFSRD